MSTESRTGLSVMLTARDMSATVPFYRDQLGFEMKESWPDDDAPMWANMVLGGQSVMVGCAIDPDRVGEMCQGNPDEEALWRRIGTEFRDNKAGVGMQVYVHVPDVDTYAETVRNNGVEILRPVKSQFYGIRDFVVADPTGYHLVFFTPIAMTSCQSCGMPMSDAQPGQMYCGYCTDEEGRLRPYEQVFEGTVTNYFMGMQKMDRPTAERAAREHLGEMPAWAGNART